MDDSTMRYRLERGAGPALVVRVPRTWRVTFGPPMRQVTQFNASRKYDASAPSLGATIRLYDGKLQRAAWMGITEYYAVDDEIEVVEDRVSGPENPAPQSDDLPF